jgi:hypothetical protein
VIEWPTAALTILPPPSATPPPARPGWARPVAVAIVVAVIAAAAVVFGHGRVFGSAGTSGALNLVHASAAKTSAAGSSKFELTMSIDDGHGNEAITGSGVTDYANHAGSMTMHAPELGDMSMVYLDNVFYMQTPTDLMGVFGGQNGVAKHRWIKLDASTLPASAKTDSLPNQMFGDPQQMLQSLVSATKAKRLGTEVVRGVATTHYSTDLSLKELARAFGGSTAQELNDLDGTARIEVWLDKAGVTHRMLASFALPELGSAAMNMEFFDFGVPVKVTAPPSDQIVDFSAMLQGIGTRR